MNEEDNKQSIILDLGCGKNKVSGAIGIDNVQLDGIDIVHDLRSFPYPFAANSIDKIYCRHVLEHFDPDMRNNVIKEIDRILKPNGILEIRVPHAFSVAAHSDPMHKSYYCFSTILFFTKGYHHDYYNGVCNNFELKQLWANLGLSGEASKFEKIIMGFPTYVFNKILFFSRTLPDLIVKMMPFFCVEIVWILKKCVTDESEQNNG